MITATQKEEILWLPFPKPSQILRQSKTANFKLWGHCFKRHSLKICSGIWCNVSMEIVDSLETENYVTNNELEIYDVNSLCYCLKIDFKNYMYNY